MDFLDFLLLSSLEEMSKPEKAPTPQPHIEIPLRHTQAGEEEPSLHSAWYTYPVIKKFFEPIADITVDEERAIVLMDIREGPATAFGVLEMGYRQEEFFKEWINTQNSLLDLSKSLAKYFTPPVALVIGSVIHPGELLFIARDGEILFDAIGDE